MADVKILSQKPILQADLFEITEVTLEKDGKQHIHKNVLQKDVVIVFPINDAKEIFLVSQYRYMHGKKLLEAVAGFIDDGEESSEAAKRELREETGYTALKWTKLASIERGSSVVKGTIHLYLAQDLEQKEQDLDDFEEITVVKMPFAEVVAAVLEGKISTSATMIGVLLLDKLMKEEKL